MYQGDYLKLYEDIGEEVLPEEYGGSNGSIKDIQSKVLYHYHPTIKKKLSENWMKRVLANKAWFHEQAKYRSDESKRPGKPKSHADIFGIEGSFRKLEID